MKKVEKADSNSKYYLIGNFKNDLDLDLSIKGAHTDLNRFFFIWIKSGRVLNYLLNRKSVTGPMKACKYSEIRLIFMQDIESEDPPPNKNTNLSSLWRNYDY